MATCTAVEPSQQVASSRSCPKPAVTSSPNLVDANELQLRVNMPSPIHDDINIKRIALIHPSKNSLQPELSGTLGNEARLTLEQIVANLRHLRPKIEIVERTDLDTVFEEMRTQMTGIIRDKDLVTVGQMLGADHLFLYEIVVTTDKEMEYVQFNGGPVGSSARKGVQVQIPPSAPNIHPSINRSHPVYKFSVYTFPTQGRIVLCSGVCLCLVS